MSKLNTNSNAYIIIYSSVLVIIVAFLLAFVYQALKPMQDANVELDVKKQILYSLNIRDLDGAAAEAKYAEVNYDSVICVDEQWNTTFNSSVECSWFE